MRRRLRRAGIYALVAAGVLTVAFAAPVAGVETRCTAGRQVNEAASETRFAIADADYRRAEGDSYLTYPEWYIVHAYANLAGVARQGSESDFRYMASIAGFWTSLCRATLAASAVGPVTIDQKVTNYIIGFSFTAEMALKGLYEKTLGAVTAWLRGPRRTPEDEFALRLLDNYAAFLQQTPWYRFPFGAELVRFWRETPLSGGNPVRKVERRFGLSLEYAGKAVYAAAIGFVAGYDPADLTIKSVVAGLDDSDLAADRRITRLRALGDGATLIQTPRYQDFTEIVRGLGGRGRSVVEIAGNDRILCTVLLPPDRRIETPGATALFALPIQSRPGWRRVGLDAQVGQLAQLIGAVERQGAVFEHAYDY